MAAVTEKVFGVATWAEVTKLDAVALEAALVRESLDTPTVIEGACIVYKEAHAA